ncbi:hypothetical protein CN689_08745 [Peribacillus butanolivorans]|uniref:DUF2624 domain-containing protein n=1 Tax=Peribacillus butanolivorans TaxID=421767 RepID=A0AAX0RS07_9BACI|nr:hypothetical protein [Peribacillus butanolivorans]PEJ34221.1 hypothetical protein CN689_08745 [Peribacillus butanolivorans]
MLINKITVDQKVFIEACIEKLEKNEALSSDEVIEVLNAFKIGVDKDSIDPTFLISFADFLISNINGFNNKTSAKKLREAFYGERIDK